LTHPSPFWAGPVLKAPQVTVVGWTRPSRSESPGMGSMSLVDVRQLDVQAAARKALDAIPPSPQVLLHFDIDVLQARECRRRISRIPRDSLCRKPRLCWVCC
jgi:hypothetical protein